MNIRRFLAPLIAIFGSALQAAPAPSAAEIHPLVVGDRVPSAVLQTADGGEIDLAAAVAHKPTLIVFYRGSWCPYCNTHLAELAEIEPQLLALGYQILAVSPDDATVLQAAAEKNRLNYRLLSDRAMHAAAAFGLAFRVDEKTVKRYEKAKIALSPIPGEPDARWLPVPAAYLVGRDGKIQFAHADADYKKRLSGETVLAAATAALRADR